MSTSVIVAGVLILLVMIVWAVCVAVAALSKRACTAVLNAGGYIYGAGAAAEEKDAMSQSPGLSGRSGRAYTAEYTFAPDQDPYLKPRKEP